MITVTFGTGHWPRRVPPTPVFRDPLVLVVATHHEPGDVLQEGEWHSPQAAQLNEMSSLKGRLREQDPVVGQDTDQQTVHACEASHERGADLPAVFRTN